MPRYKHPIRLLLLASLLLGLGHIALLPPFEGFDETGHYSYIQQLADTGRWPRAGDKMSRDIDDYLKVAPTAENMRGAWSYPEFFAAGADTIERGRQMIKEPPAKPRHYEPGQIDNWQAQHPPLYYYVIAPSYLASAGWSLAAQLFLLRGLSYVIAWSGLCIVVTAMLRAGLGPAAALLSFGIALWPAIFPMWFPEMGRLGNDSLITVFAACTLILVIRSVGSGGLLREYALLGATLGLALLTKATFLPVAAAVFALLGFFAAMARAVPELLARRIKGTFICAVVTAIVCGWWYATKYLETGSFIGSNDDVVVKSAGGLIAGLSKNVEVSSALHAPWRLLGSFLWAGTWSFIRPPRITVLPLVIMAAIIAYGSYRYLKGRTLQLADWFALLTLVLFSAALAQHSLVLLAITGNPAPAWYLHSVAPILGLLVGYGLADAAQAPGLRRLTIGLLIYTPAFLLGATLLNTLFFAGCASLLPGRRYISLADGMNCLANVSHIGSNLAVITEPDIGLTLLLAGSILMIVGIITAARHLRALAKPASPRPDKARALPGRAPPPR